jgi:hypothetical protein
MSSAVSATLGRIFISYRREDTEFAAALLFDRLVAHFGEGQIFKDIDSIEPGDVFADVIRAALASCEVVLVLIGDQWLMTSDDNEQRRLDDPADFVRLEIEAALARHIPVIPVLVGRASIPRAAELPSSLAELAERQAFELSPARSDAKLLSVLDRILNDASAKSSSGVGGWLEFPKDGDEVGGRIEVRGHVTGRWHDHGLWIVHRKEPQGLFWPKHPKIRPDDRGKFSVWVMEGGRQGRLIISLLAVPLSRSREFETWLQQAAVTGHYPGISPSGVDDEVTSVTVSYTPDV